MNLRTASLGVVISILILSYTVPAYADSQIEKTLSLSPGGRFFLESDNGSVSVSGTDKTAVNVTITSNRDDLQDLFEFSFDEEPGAVRVRARRRNQWSWFENLNLHLHYEIRVPRATRLEIRTAGGPIEINSIDAEADLATSGGGIEVLGVNGRLLAHTSGGPVQIREIRGDADVGTSGGGIEADSVEGSLVARTSGGSIRITRVTGRVDAHTSGGGIAAVLGKQNAHGGVLATSGGSISASIDPTANLDIDASTSGGHVSSDLPIRVHGTISPHHLHGILGSGGQTLSLRTSGGSIHLGAL